MPTGIQLSSGIVVGVPKPIDAKYGPYDSVALAIADVTADLRYQGLTVGIRSGGAVTEYWFKDGTENQHFVAKSSDATWDSLSNKPSTFPPAIHQHAISDVTGLQTALEQKESRIGFTNTAASNADSVLGAGRNQIVSFDSYNFTQNRSVTLPRSNEGTQRGDTLTFTHKAQFHTGGPWSVVLRQYEVVAPQGSPQYGTGFVNLITVADGETVDLVAIGDQPITWSIKNPSKHTHTAAAISDSTAAGRALLTAATVQAQRTALDIFVSAANLAAIQAQTGSFQRVYVAQDTGKSYVWNGTAYSEISPNVQANWNANSGDAQILNKPSTFPPSAHTHPYDLVVACSDEVTALTAGEKVRFLSPRSFTFTRLGASVTTAPQGASLLVDVRVNGFTVFENSWVLLTIPSGQTSFFTTAQELGGLNVDQVNQNDVISIHIIQTGVAEKGRGLKVYLTGQ